MPPVWLKLAVPIEQLARELQLRFGPQQIELHVAQVEALDLGQHLAGPHRLAMFDQHVGDAASDCRVGPGLFVGGQFDLRLGDDGARGISALACGGAAEWPGRRPWCDGRRLGREQRCQLVLARRHDGVAGKQRRRATSTNLPLRMSQLDGLAHEQTRLFRVHQHSSMST